MRPINPPDTPSRHHRGGSDAVPRVVARGYPSIESVLAEYENTPIDDSDEEAEARAPAAVRVVQVVEATEHAGVGDEVEEEQKEEDGVVEKSEHAESAEGDPPSLLKTRLKMRMKMSTTMITQMIIPMMMNMT
jgi:hypothetical protein